HHLRGIYDFLVMPGLHTLDFTKKFTVALPVFSSWLTENERTHQIYPALRSLRLYIELLSHDVLKKLTRALPDVTNITLKFSIWPAHDTSALEVICDKRVWPHLDTLTIDFCHCR